MRRPTTEEQAGLRALLDRAYFRPDDGLTAAEQAAAAWLVEVLQTSGDDLVEVLIDVDARDREQRWCSSGCPGNDGYSSCTWYDLFDTPPDGPDILETESEAAPQLCPFRQPGRAVLVRAL